MMISSHNDLVKAVCETVESFQLLAERKVSVGRTLWGSNRIIDVVAFDPETGERLGILCRYQGTSGTTYEKIPAQIDDMRAWPIRGVVVLAGDEFTLEFKGYLRASGFAIEFEELDAWLRLFFGRDLG